MKRKFFSTLLFGALACATLGTVTSCKDYDDDINNLQEQIDKKAALDKVNDLVTQVTAAESQAKSAYDLAASKASKDDVEAAKTVAVDAAKKAAQEIADAAANDAKNAADAAKKAQETADKAVKDAGDVAAKLKDYVLASELKTQLENLKKELEDGSIKELSDKVDGYTNAINSLYSAVTEVSLVGSFSSTTTKYTDNFNLSVKTGEVKNDYVFGEKEVDDLKGEHHANPTVTYKKGTQFGITNDFLIRVNPVNATVTPEMIKLIDSKGNDLDDVFEISKVEKYDELITRGSGNATGLWKVTATPKLKTDDTKKAVSKDGDQRTKIVYAVAVNNTSSQAEKFADAADRYVVSTYDLTFEASKWSKSNADDLHMVKVYSETTMGKEAAKYLSQVKVRDTYKNNYHGNFVVPAKSGENIIVDFSKLADKAEWFYVVRDDKHAGESDASEINAWNAYDYAGHETMYAANEDGKVVVTIPSTAKAGDEICFRVFAIDYEGNLLTNGEGTTNDKTTGHSFSVYVNAENATASVIGNIKVTGETTAETAWLPITGTLTDDGLSIINGINSLSLKVSDQETWTVKAEFAKSIKADGTKNANPTTNSEIKYVKFTKVGNANLSTWTDDATASAAYEIKENFHNTITDVLNISLTKELPTQADAKAKVGYQWKDKQLVNGVYTAYLFPTGDNWQTTATSGYKDLNQALNKLAKDEKAYVRIANAKLGTAKNNSKKAYDADLVVTGNTNAAQNWNMTVSNEPAPLNNVKLIDNKTQHNAVFGYNYGKISSSHKVNGAVVDYELDVTDDAFKVVFACPLDPSVQTFKFNNYVISATSTTPEEQVAVNELYYNAQNSLVPANEAKLPNGHKSISRYIVAQNSFDNEIFGGSWFGDDWKTGDVFKKYILTDSKVELLSDGTGKVDYFTCEFTTDGQIEFTQISGTTNPVENVPSTLKLTLKDCFGHMNVYTVPFTVLRR